MLPAAFFLLLSFSVSSVKHLFFLRLVYFLFLFVVFVLCSRFRLERIQAMLSGGIALVLFLYGIIQKFFIFPWILEQAGTGPTLFAQALRDRIVSGRIFAIFSLPTLYAMVCGMLLLFVIHNFYHAQGWRRVPWFLLLLLGWVNLILTQSFGGILFFAVAVLFYIFAARIFDIKYLAPLLMVLALVFFLVTALRFSEARELAPAKLRFANWLQAGRVIAVAPLLGVGLGNYEVAVPAHVYPGEPASIYAHNFFLQLAAETGLPLFILLVVISIPFIRKNLGVWLHPENALFASVCVLILIFNLFDIGNYFFAAGISFSVVFSQLAAPTGRARPLHFAAVALLAGLLLVNEISAGQQKTGDLWLSRQDLVRAQAGYRRALDLDPFSYRAWLGVAHIAWQQGDLPGSERALDRVLRIYPDQPYANYLLSQAEWRRGAYVSAMLHARHAATAVKKNKEYQRWHGIIQKNIAQQLPLSGN